MKFTVAILFATTAWGTQHHHRDTTDNGINLPAISSALENMMANQTASANFANISPPPKSLIPEILSVVPVSVIWELINPAERSTLASQFKSGTTPAWYSALPSDVKSYMLVVKSQISAGALTSETNTAANTGTAAIAATATATGNSGSATSTSKGAAAQPTGLAMSALGALGVMGLALAL